MELNKAIELTAKFYQERGLKDLAPAVKVLLLKVRGWAVSSSSVYMCPATG